LNPEEIDRSDWFEPVDLTEWMPEKPEEFASAFILVWNTLISDK